VNAPRPLDVFECPLDGITLIEASAGTGKTWNICGLVLRLLLERRLEVRQVLVVTFTNAATAELRDRIRARIAETLRHLRGRGDASGDEFVARLLNSQRRRTGATDDEMRTRLEAALQTFDEASIFTIHGFCQRALADTPFSAALPMRQDLLTDDDALRLEVVSDFWRRHVAIDTLSPELASELAAQGDSPLRWARVLRRHVARPLLRVRWPEPREAAAPDDVAALRRTHEELRKLWAVERETIAVIVRGAIGNLNGNSYKPASVETAIDSWDAALAADDPFCVAGKLPKLELLARDKLKPNKGKPAPQPHPFFERAQHWLDTRARLGRGLALRRAALLRRMLEESPARLAALKRERRVVAFDDMLGNLHTRLAGPGGQALAATLRHRFPAALIDEFQDTDPLQFAIFRTVYGDGRLPLFLVGDPKQAIYSFRNADLPTYLQARELAGERWTLTHNQRSTPALIGALNALFGRNPAVFMLPGLDYTAVQAGSKPRKPLLDASGNARAPLQMWTLPLDAEGRAPTKGQARQACVQATAGEIARLLAAARRGQVSHGGQPLAGSDIAVLVRSHRQGSRMRQALAALGVDSIELSQASVFATGVAEELVQVLAAVLEPGHDRVRRAALATTLMGRDAAAIAALDDDEPAQLALLERFAAWRERWLARGVGVMLRQWMADEGVAGRLLAQSAGERRLTDLRHLCEVLHEASFEHPAPEALLRWLQARRQDPRNDEETQLRLESDRDLVRIVTIHKSKGLEYPLVFLPFAWDADSGGPVDAKALEYHDDEGRPVVDYRGLAGAPDDADDIRHRIAQERAAEDLRLLYVALTRAVHRCTVVIGAYAVGNSTKRSRAALPHWLVDERGIDPAGWLQSPPEVAETMARWHALADANPGLIAVSAMPDEAPRPLPPHAAQTASIVMREPAPTVPPAWRLGSYSSLMQGARHEGAAIDHDARAPARGDAIAAAADIDEDDILRFARGPVAGECLHAVFEQADFTRAESWPPAVERALQDHFPDDPAQRPRQRRQLLRMLGDVLGTPLDALDRPLCLTGVPTSRRVAELEFHLPSPQLDLRKLREMLARRGATIAVGDGGRLAGYLRGFIDLVFEQEGRFHVVDWKSNHLGERPADYAQATMAAEMTRHGYHLQGLLYAVAVHRLLRRRIAGYRFDTHFGGVHYLFVRGMRPGWRQPDGRASGVFRLPLDGELVQATSALLEGGTA
jgi:exodeoxyribonuclease V beta subunit